MILMPATDFWIWRLTEFSFEKPVKSRKVTKQAEVNQFLAAFRDFKPVWNAAADWLVAGPTGLCRCQKSKFKILKVEIWKFRNWNLKSEKLKPWICKNHRWKKRTKFRNFSWKLGIPTTTVFQQSTKKKIWSNLVVSAWV